ncbi:MAG: hypothetical protein WCO02_11130 [Bacteroidota bacterium]
MKQGTKIYSVLFAVSFMAWLLLPFLLSNLVGGKKKAVSREELSSVLPRPVFNPGRLDPFPGEFERYYYNRFPQKDTLLKWWSVKMGADALKRAPERSMVDIGEDGWLFAADERPVYEGLTQLSAENIELIHQTIRNRVIFFKAQGIRFYVFIIPMKSVIYPEYLPSYYYHYSDTTLTQKVISVLSSDTLIPFINVNPSLINAKPKGELFTRTEKSWNSLGAYEAYKQVISRIARDFPAVQAVTFGEFGKVRVTPNGKLPKALVIRDPQIEQMIPFLDQNFSKTVYIFDAWMYDLNWDIIQKEKPDIVLLEMYEPYVKNILHLKP